MGAFPEIWFGSKTSTLRTRPGALKRTRLSPATAATERFPPSVSRVPVLRTRPPNRLRLRPSPTAKLPSLTIAPGSSVANSKALGSPTNSAQLFSPRPSNQPPSKPIPVALVAVKSPATLRLAPAPKTIPAGLMRNRFASLPETCNRPLIDDGFPPTTRPRILSILGVDRKFAVCPASSPNS